MSFSTATSAAVTFVAHVEFSECHHGQTVPTMMLQPREDRPPTGLGAAEVENSRYIVKVRRAPGGDWNLVTASRSPLIGRMVTGCSFLRRSGAGPQPGRSLGAACPWGASCLLCFSLVDPALAGQMGGDSSGDSDAQQVRSGAWASPVSETFWVILMTSRGGAGGGDRGVRKSLEPILALLVGLG